MKDKIKLALAQISSKRENKDENLSKFEKITQKAKEQGADLVIFPELSLDRLRCERSTLRIGRTHPRSFSPKGRRNRKENKYAHNLWNARAKRKNPSNPVQHCGLRWAQRASSASIAKCICPRIACLKKKGTSVRDTKRQPLTRP